ncbi:MAG: ATP-binding protein [Tenuifilaceae bacterium]
MINRELYLKKIVEFIDKPLIKIITGIRRSGKSSVLVLITEELRKRGISKEQIIYINFESFAFSNIENSANLYDYICKKITADKRHYIILDEIQEVSEWEKAVNSLIVDHNVDVYITGSNSHLLSSELATYLAGRYVEFHILTLSFGEYLKFKEEFSIDRQDIYSEFENYIRIGGFPVLHTAKYSLETAYKVVIDIYSSVILRDTIQRNSIRDVEMLERVVKYVFDNIGNKFSGKNVADYFKSQQRKVDINTVYNYLKALESAFIIHRISRYDVKGKEILKTQEKFYVADTALLYAVMGYKDRLIAGVLENIVMLELKRRGYEVYVGKLDTTEIDFVATKGNDKLYIQVAYQLSEQSTVDREFAPLLQVKDNYPKYVVTMDKVWKDNISGVRHLHIAEFLLLEKF